MANSCIQRPKLADLGFAVDDCSVFYRPQWRKFPLLVFAIYRVVLALYVLGFFIGVVVISTRNEGGASFVYLTTIAFMVFIAYNWTAALDVILDGYVRPHDPLQGAHTHLRHKIHWFLFSMTTNINFLVTLVYWIALYTPSLPLIYDLNMHTLTSVVCLVDLFLTSMPVRLLHFIYPLLLGTVYLVFTLIFWAAGGFDKHAIYPFLDYSNKPGQAVGAIIGMFVAVILMQGVVWALYKLRLWIWERCSNGTTSFVLQTESVEEDNHCVEDENSVHDKMKTQEI